MRDVKGSAFTVPQFRALGFVSLQACTTKQLADWQGVSLPAMSRMVDHLVRRRLLVHLPDTVDRRQVNLRLSGKGKAEFKRSHKALQTRLAKGIMRSRDADKRAMEAGLIVVKELFSET